jgi:hypothetical protein
MIWSTMVLRDSDPSEADALDHATDERPPTGIDPEPNRELSGILEVRAADGFAPVEALPHHLSGIATRKPKPGHSWNSNYLDRASPTVSRQSKYSIDGIAERSSPQYPQLF